MSVPTSGMFDTDRNQVDRALFQPRRVAERVQVVRWIANTREVTA